MTGCVHRKEKIVRTQVQKLFVVSLLACSVAACVTDAAPDDPAAHATEDQEIIGGVVSGFDPSVVMLFVDPARGAPFVCSGTVIAPFTVLTAAHCIPTGATFGLPSIHLGFGVTPSPTIQASSWIADPQFSIDFLQNGHDIGIVHTAAPLPAPAAVRGVVNGAFPVRLAGYGNDANGSGFGTKRTVTTTITQVFPRTFSNGRTGQQICHGDSGGPAFQSINGQEVLVGVASFTSPAGCFDGGTHDRVDFFAGFINANTF